jgi:PST family polysaccharide transporter
MMPVNAVGAPVYAAAMPALSRLVDQPARYRSLFGQVMQKIALLTMPAFALSAVTADWVVGILFGPSWEQAVPLVVLFSIAATSLPVAQSAGLLYLTHARTTEMLRANLIDASLCVASILAGLHWGVDGVAASLAAVGVLVRMPLAFWLATRRGPVPVGVIWRAIAPPATAAAAVAVSVGALREFLQAPTVAALAATVAVALSAMSLALVAWPETRREIQALMSSGKLLRPSTSG